MYFGRLVRYYHVMSERCSLLTLVCPSYRACRISYGVACRVGHRSIKYPLWLGRRGLRGAVASTLKQETTVRGATPPHARGLTLSKHHTPRPPRCLRPRRSAQLELRYRRPVHCPLSTAHDQLDMRHERRLKNAPAFISLSLCLSLSILVSLFECRR